MARPTSIHAQRAVIYALLELGERRVSQTLISDHAMISRVTANTAIQLLEQSGVILRYASHPHRSACYKVVKPKAIEAGLLPSAYA